MAELNMQGEHHVNTFLGHEKKKKKKHKPGRTLLLHAPWFQFNSLLATSTEPEAERQWWSNAMQSQGPFEKNSTETGRKNKIPHSTHVK